MGVCLNLPETPRPFVRLDIESHYAQVTLGVSVVTWVIDRRFDAPGPWTFVLRRHQTVADDQPVEVSTAVDVRSLEDRSPRVGQFEIALAYSVELTDGDGDQYVSQVTPVGSYWGHRDWLMCREITRKELMLLQKRTGTPGWLLKRRWWGDSCPKCVDEVTGSSSDPSCPVCYGTGIRGGYYPAIKCLLALEPTKRMVRLTADQGVVTAVEERARALPYPVVETNDMWVHGPTGKRYQIKEDVETIAQHRGVPLVMRVGLTLSPISSNLYAVPVPNALE